MRPAWLEVNFDSLAHNVNLLRGAGGVSLIGVVKANAYGHGAVEVGKELLRLGAWGLAVSTVGEGKQLREGGIAGKILLMGSLHPDQAGEVLEARLIPTLSTFEAVGALDTAARGHRGKAPVHLKFDTGMGRIGFLSSDAAIVKERIAQYPSLEVTGIYSHFADAEEDRDWTLSQIANFEHVRSVFGAGYFYHMCNTPGTFNYPQAAYDAIRPGIGLYGLLPNFGLKPIARLLAKPTLVKCLPAGRKIGYGGLYTTQGEEWIATLPLGYADGMPRLLVAKADVRMASSGPDSPSPICPVIGRISMDQITVKLPGAVGLDQVFEVVTADFDPRSSLWGWAESTGTVSYEPAVRLSTRLPRVYLRGGVEVARVE
jgi:alanine racemase